MRVHITCEKYTFIVGGIHYLWEVHIYCGKYMYVGSTHYMWQVHIACEKYTFLVESTHCMWKVHIICGKYTFIVKIHKMWKVLICGKCTFTGPMCTLHVEGTLFVESTHYMLKVVLYYTISFAILFANIYKVKACYSLNLITSFIMNKNI